MGTLQWFFRRKMGQKAKVPGRLGVAPALRWSIFVVPPQRDGGFHLMEIIGIERVGAEQQEDEVGLFKSSSNLRIPICVCWQIVVVPHRHLAGPEEAA